MVCGGACACQGWIQFVRHSGVGVGARGGGGGVVNCDMSQKLQ